MLDVLFQNLAVRLCNENDLSDITWIMCQSSNNFQKCFLEYIFGPSVDFDSPFDLVREYSENGSDRPDISLVFNDEVKYIIEVKIYDRDDHFEQYGGAYQNARFGFIANYHHEKRGDISVRTWEGFYDRLGEIPGNDVTDDEEKKIIGAYRHYLKEVCGIMKVNKINFNDLSSLYYFNGLVRKCIEEKNYRLHNIKSNMSDDYSGKYFSLQTSGGKVAYLWFGIFYNDSMNNIYISMEPQYNDNKSLIENFMKKSSGAGKYFQTPYIDNSNLWFELDDKYFGELCDNAVSIDRKIETIKNFFNEVMALFPR